MAGIVLYRAVNLERISFTVFHWGVIGWTNQFFRSCMYQQNMNTILVTVKKCPSTSVRLYWACCFLCFFMSHCHFLPPILTLVCIIWLYQSLLICFPSSCWCLYDPYYLCFKSRAWTDSHQRTSSNKNCSPLPRSMCVLLLWKEKSEGPVVRNERTFNVAVFIRPSLITEGGFRMSGSRRPWCVVKIKCIWMISEKWDEPSVCALLIAVVCLVCRFHFFSCALHTLIWSTTMSDFSYQQALLQIQHTHMADKPLAKSN